MKHPARTLLYDLFVLPPLRLLQAGVDGIDYAITASRKVFESHEKRSSENGFVRRDARNGTFAEQYRLVARPIYELAGEGLSNRAIAARLNLSEITVHGCLAWLVRSLRCRDRRELVFYACRSRPESRSLHETAGGMITSVRRWRQRKRFDSLVPRQ